MEGSGQKNFTGLARRKLDGGDFEGFTTKGEKTKKKKQQPRDESAGTLMPEKLLAMIEKHNGRN